MAILAGIAVGTAVAGGIGRARGAKQAQGAAKDQARLMRQTTAEAARRLERGQERTLGQAKAGVYASGIEMSGTSERYVRDMQSEMARELDWLKKSGESAASAMEKGADVQFNAAQWANLGQTAGSIGRAVGGAYG